MTETEATDMSSPVGEFITLVYYEGIAGHASEQRREFVGRASMIVVDVEDDARMVRVLGHDDNDFSRWEFRVPAHRVMSSLIVSTFEARVPVALIVDYAGTLPNGVEQSGEDGGTQI